MASGGGNMLMSLPRSALLDRHSSGYLLFFFLWPNTDGLTPVPAKLLSSASAERVGEIPGNVCSKEVKFRPSNGSSLIAVVPITDPTVALEVCNSGGASAIVTVSAAAAIVSEI